MRANYDYYNHRYYNYDYEDMKDITFSYDRNEQISMTSKVYPTKLEVKIDEESNIPYLYYEGIVQTNKGPMKITFPKLDLSLDCVQIQATKSEMSEYLGYKYQPKITQYKMITEFCNIGRDDVMYELQMFGEEDYKSMKEHFDRKWNR